MNLIFEDEVQSDLKEFSERLQARILRHIFNLEEDPLPNNSYVIQLPEGSQVQCLKLQENDRNSDLNHRVTYDISGNQIRIYGIFFRKPGFDRIKSETQNRMK